MPPSSKKRRRRPNLPPDELRAKQMVVAVTRDEFEAYDTTAARLGLSLSMWARRALAAALDGPVRRGSNKPKAGRVRRSEPPAASARLKRMALRLRQNEWDAYLAEAKRQRLVRSEWARRVLNRAVARTGPRRPG